MLSEKQEILYEIRESSCCNGKGLFATRRINRGELILMEKPILTMVNNGTIIDRIQLQVKISKLSEQDKTKFFELYDSNSPDKPTEFGIIKTNALRLGRDSEYGGIFPIISRINHSCLPNVCHWWDQKNQVEKIYPLKTIEQGEEILTSYISLYSDRTTRRNKLKQTFNFECQCKLCSLNDEKAIEQSDLRRRKIKELDDSIPILTLLTPQKALSNALEIKSLLIEEKIEYDATFLIRVYYDIFSLLYQTTKKNLKFWAKLTVDNMKICQGEVSNCRLKDELLYYYNR